MRTLTGIILLIFMVGCVSQPVTPISNGDGEQPQLVAPADTTGDDPPPPPPPDDDDESSGDGSGSSTGG